MWSTSTGVALFCQPEYPFHLSSNALRYCRSLGQSQNLTVHLIHKNLFSPDYNKFFSNTIFHLQRPLPVISTEDGDHLLRLKVLKSHIRSDLENSSNNVILLKYHASVFPNVAIAQQMLLSLVDKPTKEVPLMMFKNPIWTTWARYKKDIDQQKVLTFAKEIIEHQFPFSVLEIDDKWCSGMHQSMM
jgi:hypothetical protein